MTIALKILLLVALISVFAIVGILLGKVAVEPSRKRRPF